MSRRADEALHRLDAARAALAASDAFDDPPASLGSIVLRDDQIETVRCVQAHLRREGGCLLADEVGTGKTYVALAIAREWKRPLVVHPASLRSTWEHAARRADVPCHFATHEALSRGRAIDRSHDGVVVDESHRFRPTTRRHAALAALTAHAPVLMLSATPLQNRVRELAAQLAIFLGEIAYMLPPDELARRVVRSATSNELPLPRVAPPRWIPIDADDGDVLRAILALPPPPRAADAGDGGVLLQLSLVRAWASSRAALTASVRRRQRVLAAIEQCHEEGRRPTRRELNSWSGGSDVQLGFVTLLAASPVHAGDDATLGKAIERERDGLDALLRTIALAEDPDSMRVAALLGVRRAHQRTAILAFSEWATTVRAYSSAMRREPGVGLLTAREARIASGRIARDELLARFAPRAQGRESPAHERVTLLLATDLLSEGVNLQDASVVVHLDLPWNPARLTQRLGRIRRPGGAREVASYLLSPPAHASLLLRVEARLRAKLAHAHAMIGRSIDVLPALGAASVRSVDALEYGAPAPGQTDPALSAAELRGEIARLLARWRSPAGSVFQQAGGAIEATVCADTTGWLALLDDGRLVASVAEGDRLGVPSESPDTIMRALRILDAAVHERDTPEPDAAHRELKEWVARDWTRRSSGLDVAQSPLRRRLRRALDDALHAAPRHQRARSFELAARIRRALDRPLALGLERALDALLDSSSTTGDWLETAADRIMRAPGATHDPAREAACCRVLVVFCRGACPCRSDRATQLVRPPATGAR